MELEVHLCPCLESGQAVLRLDLRLGGENRAHGHPRQVLLEHDCFMLLNAPDYI
jgi:hypothetical protein